MLKVVVDTNVIISALNFGGKPSEIVDLARSRQITNITSQFILDEVEGVLIGKFSWEAVMARKAQEAIKAFSEMVTPQERISAISNCEADNRIIECALKGNARFIISGDHHLTDLGEYQGIKIYGPSTFLELIS